MLNSCPKLVWIPDTYQTYFRSPDRRDRRDGSSARRSGGQGAYRGGGGGGGKSTSNSRRAPPERRIFVSNIPFEMKWQEVKVLFCDNVVSLNKYLHINPIEVVACVR